MRTAVRILFLDLRVRFRSLKPWSLVMIAIFSVASPLVLFKLATAVGSWSVRPVHLLPFVTGSLSVLLIMHLTAALGSAFTYLYVSRDLPLILASPVRPRDVILAKILEISVSGVGVFLVTGLPFLAGLGASWFAPWWYYPLTLLATIPYVMLPVFVAVGISLVMCRLVPQYRSRELVGSLTTLVGAAAYLLIRGAGYTLSGRGSTESVTKLLVNMGRSWSPATALARAVIAGLMENPRPLLIVGGALIAVSFGIFRLVTQFTERAYLTGWASREVRRRSQTDILVPKASSGTRRPWAADLSGPFSVERLSLVVEAKLFFRDLQSQSQALYAAAMILAFVVFPRGGGSSPLTSQLPFYLYLAMVGSYASWSLRNAPATGALLRKSPGPSCRVMRGKALFYGVVEAAFLILLLGISHLLGRLQGVTPLLLFIWLILCFTTAAATTCCAARYRERSDSTGIPRMGAAGGITLLLATAGLVLTGVLAHALSSRAMGRSLLETCVYLILFVWFQAWAFVYCADLAGRHIDGVGGESGQESPHAKGSFLAILALLGAVVGAGLGSPVSAGSCPGPDSLPGFSYQEVGGIRLYFKRVPGADRAGIAALMQAGTWDQAPDEAHCAHMAEHMVIMYPSQNGESLFSIVERDYSLGAPWHINGYTSTDSTLFAMEVDNQDVPIALGTLIGSMFRNNIADDQEFRLEIKRAQREITAITTREPHAIVNKMRQSMFENTPVYERLFETPLGEVSAEMVRGFIEREYTPKRLSLVVFGDLDEPGVVQVLENALDGIPPGQGPAERAVIINPPKTVRAQIPSLSKPYLGLALGIDGVDPGDYDALGLLFNVVLRRMYSKTGTDLRFEPDLHTVLFSEGVAVATYAFSPRRSDVTDDVVSAAFSAIRETMESVIKELAAEGPFPGELEIFTPPSRRNIQVPESALPPTYAEASRLIQTLASPLGVDPILSEAQSNPGEALHKLSKVAAKYLPAAKMCSVYATGAPSGAATVILALAVLAAVLLVGWWLLQKTGQNGY